MGRWGTLGFWAFLILFSQNAFSAAAANPPLKDAPKEVHRPDPMMEKAWHLLKIGAPQAWTITKGDSKVAIAFVDSGIQYNHLDLNANLKRNLSEWPFDGKDSDENGLIDDVIGWDFVNGTNLPWDRSGHGTFIAGIAAARLDNGIGMAGVCPQCSILAYRFLNRDGLGDTSDAMKGIYRAIKAGAKVINLSFAGEGYDGDFHKLLAFAAQRDIVVVAAAGNDGESNDRNAIYPANFKLPNIIAVAAATKDGDIWENSNYGAKNVHVAAPGEEIWGPWIDGSWDHGNGTSLAAPIVAGAIGLLRSAHPWLSAPQAVQIMMASCKKTEALERKVKCGGVIDLWAAMKLAERLKP